MWLRVKYQWCWDPSSCFHYFLPRLLQFSLFWFTHYNTKLHILRTPQPRSLHISRNPATLLFYAGYIDYPFVFTCNTRYFSRLICRLLSNWRDLWSYCGFYIYYNVAQRGWVQILAKLTKFSGSHEHVFQFWMINHNPGFDRYNIYCIHESQNPHISLSNTAGCLGKKAKWLCKLINFLHMKVLCMVFWIAFIF